MLEVSGYSEDNSEVAGFRQTQEALDGLLDRINEGTSVLVTPEGKVIYYDLPEAGTYRLVPWDTEGKHE